MNFKTLSVNEEPEWDAFCQANPDAWFWQTTHFVRYQEHYRPTLHTVPKHLLCYRESKLVAICPLALETYDGNTGSYKAYTLGGGSLPTPVIEGHLLPSDRDRLQREVFQEIDRLAALDGVSKILMRSSLLTPRFLNPTVAPENEYIRFGYLDESLHSQVLDLRNDLSKIWADFRKSYHSPIRRAEEHFEFRVLDKNTITPELFEAYKNLHHKASGRVTRSAITFQMMYQWVINGHAVLCQALQEGQIGACVLVLLYKNEAYYGSACNDPKVEKQWAVGPYMQWHIIQYLAQKGYTHYDLGWQFFGPQMAYQPSHQELQISFFKRGFGGRPVPNHCVQKYYDRDLFMKEYASRVQKIADSLMVPVV